MIPPAMISHSQSLYLSCSVVMSFTLRKLVTYYFKTSLLCPLKSSTRTPHLSPSNTPISWKITSLRQSMVTSPVKFAVFLVIICILFRDEYIFPALSGNISLISTTTDLVDEKACAGAPLKIMIGRSFLPLFKHDN